MSLISSIFSAATTASHGTGPSPDAMDAPHNPIPAPPVPPASVAAPPSHGTGPSPDATDAPHTGTQASAPSHGTGPSADAKDAPHTYAPFVIPVGMMRAMPAVSHGTGPSPDAKDAPHTSGLSHGTGPSADAKDAPHTAPKAPTPSSHGPSADAKDAPHTSTPYFGGLSGILQWWNWNQENPRNQHHG